MKKINIAVNGNQPETKRVCDEAGKEHIIRWSELGMACAKASYTRKFPTIENAEPLNQCLHALYLSLKKAYTAAHDIGVADDATSANGKKALAANKTAKAGAVQALKNLCELLATRINHKGTRKSALVVTDTSIEYLYGVLAKRGGVVSEQTFNKNAMPNILLWIVGYPVSVAEEEVKAEKAEANAANAEKREQEKKDKNAEKENLQGALAATESNVAKLELEKLTLKQTLREAIEKGVKQQKIDAGYAKTLLDLLD